MISSIRRILNIFPDICKYSSIVEENIRCFARANDYRSQSPFSFSTIPRWSCRYNRLHICIILRNMCFFSNLFFLFLSFIFIKSIKGIQKNTTNKFIKVYGNEGKKWIRIKINNRVTRPIGQLPKIQRKNRRPICTRHPQINPTPIPIGPPRIFVDTD